MIFFTYAAVVLCAVLAAVSLSPHASSSRPVASVEPVDQQRLHRIVDLETEVATLRQQLDAADVRSQMVAAGRASRSRPARSSAPRPLPPAALPVPRPAASAPRPASTQRRSSSPQAGSWAQSSYAIQVANCESADLPNWPHSDGSRYTGNAHDRSNPSYRGKWQMGFTEWADTGGSGDPADASEAEQDMRAHKLWESRGWQPWDCARILGTR